MTQTPEGLRLALDAIQDLKAHELVVLDLRGLTDATDYFVIASGTSDAWTDGFALETTLGASRMPSRTPAAKPVW